MSEPTYSTGASARRLGISQHYLRRLCETGLVDADQTEGGHWRIFAREIERLLQEGIPPLPAPPAERPNPARTSPVIPRVPETPAAPGPMESDDVREARDSVAIVEHKLTRRRLELDTEEVEDQFRERERMRQAEQEEAERRQAQTSAAEARRPWLEGKIETVLFSLPRDCPANIRLNVQDGVRAALKDLTPQSAKGITDQVIGAAVETALEPYHAAKRVLEAIEAGVSCLPLSAQYQDSPWEAEARTAVRTALNKLAGIQDPPSMRMTARAAVAPIVQRFEHGELVSSALNDVRFWRIGNASAAERKAAQKAAVAALNALPVGASKEDVEEAKREALEPHENALRQRLKEAERELKVLQVVERGMAHVSHYLLVGEWTFDSYSERMETERELKTALRPHLEEIAEARQVKFDDVEHYVENWVDGQLEELTEGDEEED